MFEKFKRTNAPENEEIEFAGEPPAEEITEEDHDPALPYLNRIRELEGALEGALEERRLRERELECLGLLRDAGLSSELCDAVMASGDMAASVNAIRTAVMAMVEAEVLHRCRSDAPPSGAVAPLTREELARLPVAEIQRIRNMGR